MKTPIAASFVALLASVPSVAAAPQFQTPAPVAYLQDLSSGAVLFQRDADRRMPPASMAKMMTVYVAFDMIKKGELKLNQTVRRAPGDVAEMARPRSRFDDVPVGERERQRR